jgi:serine O-acetyltransferase
MGLRRRPRGSAAFATPPVALAARRTRLPAPCGRPCRAPAVAPVRASVADRSAVPPKPRVSHADPVQVSDDAAFGPRVTTDEMLQALQGEADPIWQLIRREAQFAAASEPQLASGLYSTVLVHTTFEETLATVLANELDTPAFQATQWMELFRDALNTDASYGDAARADISAFVERDPATSHASCVLLYSKGFQALQAWRLSHWLWNTGRDALALYLQSMISSRFAVDIHPAATIGSGVLFDHGTGLVVGETASVGNNVSILQNVTLGGTGKEVGDRHPKVSDGVMIGAGATVLGNIVIGEGAHIAACSVVLKAIEPYAIVSGVPARVVGKVTARTENGRVQFPSFAMDQRLSIEVLGAANPYQGVVTGAVMGSNIESHVDGGGGSNI